MMLFSGDVNDLSAIRPELKRGTEEGWRDMKEIGKKDREMSRIAG
jgi:hypothetical protein